MSGQTAQDIHRAAWSAVAAHEVVAFLGPNSGAFRRSWEHGREKGMISGHGLVRGWSWSGFLFGFAWLMYRKQWWSAVFALVAPIMAAYIFPGQNAAAVMIGVLLGLYGKSYIVQDAVTRIDRIKRQGGGLVEITAVGGVSMPAGIVGGIIWTLAFVAGLTSHLTKTIA